jgi:acyl-CoA synthetase (AMP-forming)/AMP-acid ligase II
MLDETKTNVAFSTFLPVEKVELVADECGVKAVLVDSSMQKGRQWLNDFEVEGVTGKVEAFLYKIKDKERK